MSSPRSDTWCGCGGRRRNRGNGARSVCGALADATEMRAILQSLPLYDWFTVEITPLSAHPSDPARA